MIELPDCQCPNGATPILVDFGGVLTPFLGGPEQRINRMGTRFGIEVSFPPMPSADAGRLFASRLLQGRQDRLRMDWPLLDFKPGIAGTKTVAGPHVSGSLLSVTGGTANYQWREGQFFNVYVNDRPYIHMITETTNSDAAGAATLPIFPMLRTVLAGGEALIIEQPVIEGHVSPGDEISWQMSIDRHLNFAFRLMEAA